MFPQGSSSTAPLPPSGCSSDIHSILTKADALAVDERGRKTFAEESAASGIASTNHHHHHHYTITTIAVTVVVVVVAAAADTATIGSSSSNTPDDKGMKKSVGGVSK
ncbi:unnamed protein product [Lasius platythorax]|uniref:Uncharacterized protein n=1 Tax=Lasius platythorax TaxID=488582 RepID=A0AAV2NA82_9HYME